MKAIGFAGAVALTIAGLAAAGSAQAQTAPQVWDGVIVPTQASQCSSDQPIFWYATYRPYISDAISGANQPSQLVVFAKRNMNDRGYRLANTADGQFNGGTNKTAAFFLINADADNITQATTGGGNTATINLTHANITAANYTAASTTWIKMTGTIKIGTGAGLFCATNISGVFVRRPPAAP
jgi:hypothetical protein